MNKNIKEIYNEIKIDETKKKDIYNNIINNKTKFNIFFKPMIASILVLTFISTVGIIYADEIKATINNIKQVYKEQEHGFNYHITANSEAIINYDAKADENKQYTEQEIETILRTKILKTPEYNYDKLSLKLFHNNDGKVTRGIISNDKNYVRLETIKEKDSFRGIGLEGFKIYFKTKYASDNEVNTYSFMKEKTIKEIYMKEFDTIANVIVMSEPILSHFIIMFEYEGFVYEINLWMHGNYTKDNELCWNRIEEFINSFIV